MEFLSADHYQQQSHEPLQDSTYDWVPTEKTQTFQKNQINPNRIASVHTDSAPNPFFNLSTIGSQYSPQTGYNNQQTWESSQLECLDFFGDDTRGTYLSDEANTNSEPPSIPPVEYFFADANSWVPDNLGNDHDTPPLPGNSPEITPTVHPTFPHVISSADEFLIDLIPSSGAPHYHDTPLLPNISSAYVHFSGNDVHTSPPSQSHYVYDPAPHSVTRQNMSSHFDNRIEPSQFDHPISSGDEREMVDYIPVYAQYVPQEQQAVYQPVPNSSTYIYNTDTHQANYQTWSIPSSHHTVHVIQDRPVQHMYEAPSTQSIHYRPIPNQSSYVAWESTPPTTSNCYHSVDPPYHVVGVECVPPSQMYGTTHAYDQSVVQYSVLPNAYLTNTEPMAYLDQTDHYHSEYPSQHHLTVYSTEPQYCVQTSESIFEYTPTHNLVHAPSLDETHATECPIPPSPTNIQQEEVNVRTEITCPHCHRCFDRPNRLRNHIRTHYGCRSTQACILCGRKFNVTSNLRRHLNSHKCLPPSSTEYHLNEAHNVTPGQHNSLLSTHLPRKPRWLCQICHEQMSNYHQYRLHMTRHKDLLVFGCMFLECKSIFQSADALFAHVLEWHAPSIGTDQVCRTCGRVFDDVRQYVQHWLPRRRGLFPRCGANRQDRKPVQNKPDQNVKVRTHIRLLALKRLSKHRDPHAFRCPICARRCSSSQRLRIHLISIHKNDLKAIKRDGSCRNEDDAVDEPELSENASKFKTKPTARTKACCKSSLYLLQMEEEHDEVGDHADSKSSTTGDNIKQTIFTCKHCGKTFQKQKFFMDHQEMCRRRIEENARRMRFRESKRTGFLVSEDVANQLLNHGNRTPFPAEHAQGCYRLRRNRRRDKSDFNESESICTSCETST